MKIGMIGAGSISVHHLNAFKANPNAEVVMIADACVKGIDGIDYEKALQLMLHAANTEPDKPRLYGRGGITQYNTMGYIPHTIERSGSRQVEYAYCDYAIAMVADHLGYHDLAKE